MYSDIADDLAVEVGNFYLVNGIYHELKLSLAYYNNKLKLELRAGSRWQSNSLSIR